MTTPQPKTKSAVLVFVTLPSPAVTLVSPHPRVRQVRDIRTGEADTYGGESTGIKSNVTRSRQLKG